MTEELTFQQIAGNGGAVDLNKGATVARTDIVNWFAISSFPVLVSPWIKTIELVGATL
jgi:hypothetical protein